MNLGRTKTGNKEMLFHQRVHSISPEQSPVEKQRGASHKNGKKKAYEWEKNYVSLQIKAMAWLQ